MVDIVVLSLRHCSEYRGVQAFVSVAIGEDIIINELRIIQSGNEQPYVLMPGRADTRNGRKVFRPYVELGNGLWAAVRSAILEAWKNSQRVAASPALHQHEQE